MTLSRVAITGAASGIGAATADLLRARGAHVTAFDVAEPSVAVDAFIRVDLADAAATDAAAAAALGPFDALCNVAGLPPRHGLAGTILRVNFLALRQFTGAMYGRLADRAAVVNVASRAGRQWAAHIDQVKALFALPDDADTDAFCRANAIDPVRAYDLSKEAVIAWTIAETARLGAAGPRLNSVSPAPVETPILADFKAAFGARATKAIGRVGRPATALEIAEVVAFLAAPASGWLNGIDIAIDGGTSAQETAEALSL